MVSYDSSLMFRKDIENLSTELLHQCSTQLETM